MPKPNVTYRQIAGAAKVSVATVSLAMRGSDLISEATTARVRKAAADLGYRPNPMVSALMHSVRLGRTGTVQTNLGIITPAASRKRSKVHPSAREIVQFAAEHAESCGFRAEEIALEDVLSAHKDMDRILAARGITGLLLDDAGELLNRLRLDWNRYGVVRIGSHQPPHCFHTVVADHLGIMRIGLSGLIERGCRRVGAFIPDWIDSVTAGDALAGYLHAREVLGHDRVVALLRSKDSLEGELVDWIRTNRLDGVLTPDHRLLMWLRQRGIAVPEQVALAHSDAIAPWWPFAGIEQDRRTLVRFALDLLIAEVSHNRRGMPSRPVIINVPVRWREGETVRPLR